MARALSENMKAAYLCGFALRDKGKSWEEVEAQLALEGFKADDGGRISENAVRQKYSQAKTGKHPLKSYFEDRAANESLPVAVSTKEPQERALQAEHDAREAREAHASQEEHASHEAYTSPEAHTAQKEPVPQELPQAPTPEHTVDHDAREAYTAQERPEDITATIRAIAREVCTEMLANVMHKEHIQHISVEGEEVPPEAETIKGPGVKGRRENRKYTRLTVGIDDVLAERFTQEAKDRGISPGKLLDVLLWNRYDKPRLSYMQDTES
jgi:hypothetical protein